MAVGCHPLACSTRWQCWRLMEGLDFSHLPPVHPFNPLSLASSPPSGICTVRFGEASYFPFTEPFAE